MSRSIEELEALAHRMDSAFRVPVIGKRIGWDSILGLVPGIGDALALAPAGYIIHSAHRMGAPRHVLARMALNTGIDTVVGAIPILGDLFDMGFKSNHRNVALLKRHFERSAARSTPVSDPRT